MSHVKSWTLPVPDGAYARIVAWNGAEHWLALLQLALTLPDGDRARRKISVSPETMMLVAGYDAGTADTSTGRGVTTAHETLATALGIAKRTVQRARELIETLGFSVTVVGGRYLTAAERQQARALHGHTQLRAASVRALTIPAIARTAQNVHLPRRGPVNPQPHLKKSIPTRVTARKAAPRLASTKSPARTGSNASSREHITRFASDLVTRLPFLAAWRARISEHPNHSPWIVPAEQHIGGICRVLQRSRINLDRLTAAEAIELMDKFSRDTGIAPMNTHTMRNPLGYLATMLKRIRYYLEDPNYQTRTERAAAATTRRAAAAERQRQAEAQRAAANTPEANAAAAAFFAHYKQSRTATA